MNKIEFANILEKDLSCSLEFSKEVVGILENHFIFCKEGLEAAQKEVKENFHLKDQEAKKIIDASIMILKKELKRKINHPFTKK